MDFEHSYLADCISWSLKDQVKESVTAEIDLFYDDGSYWRMAILRENDMILDCLYLEFKHRLLLKDGLEHLRWKCKLRECLEDAFDSYPGLDEAPLREKFADVLPQCNGSCSTSLERDLVQGVGHNPFAEFSSVEEFLLCFPLEVADLVAEFLAMTEENRIGERFESDLS